MTESGRIKERQSEGILYGKKKLKEMLPAAELKDFPTQNSDACGACEV